MPELEPISPLIIEAKSAFQEFLDQVNGWQDEAQTIVVETIHDKAAMQKAKELRLKIRTARTTADKRRKEMKADSIAYGKAIQSMYELVEKATKPLEEELENKEKFVQRQEEKRINKVGGDRLEIIKEFIVDDSPLPDIAFLANMDETIFETVLSGYKQRQQEYIEIQEKIADAVDTAKQNEELEAKNAQLKAEAKQQAKKHAEEIAKNKAIVEAAEKRLGELRELLPILEYRDGGKLDATIIPIIEKWMVLLSDVYDNVSEGK